MVKMTHLQDLAKQAGVIIRDGFKCCSKAESEWKEDSTPCTASDVNVNQLVLNFFKKDYPNFSVIAEEGSSEQESDWVAYCDPIDGTIPYATGLPISTFCLSLVHKGIPVSALIYDPFRDRMYSAEKGKGSFMNGQKLTVSQQRTVDSKTHASVIWWNNSPYNFSETCSNLQSKGVKWMNLGTIGITGGLIASGQFEASLFPGNKLWETAAMSLIVEEAGGRCTDLFGNPIDFTQKDGMKGHLISNEYLHDEILSLIKL